MNKRKLLWIGDAAVASGFARCTHKTLEAFEGTWDISVLGLNYHGDPHKYPYDIYPCAPGGDPFGLGRVKKLVGRIRPDLVIIQNDPWNIREYMKRVGNVPTVAAIAVDGVNMAAAQTLNGLAGAIFWTEFGLNEARTAGYTGPAAVVPLGVDLEVYKPIDRAIAREKLGLPFALKDAFIVGSVARNHPRKRLDLTVEYFARWVRQYNVRDAYLYLHVAPTGDAGYDVSQLMQYYKLANRLIISEPDIIHGVPEKMLVSIYSAFDVQVSTGIEGWGLPIMEGMACGIPQIVPDWSALGEWAKDTAIQIPCSSFVVTPGNINVIGGVPDREPFIEALQSLYSAPHYRQSISEIGLNLVNSPMYNWQNIAVQFRTAVEQFLGTPIITNSEPKIEETPTVH